MNIATQLAITLVGSIAVSGILAAAEIPLEDYGRPATVTNMAISPDGDRVAFRRRDETMDAVFIVDRQSNDVIGAVDGSESKIRRVHFLDQDRLVLFAEDAQNISSHYTTRKSQVSSGYIFDLRTNELTKLLGKSRRLYPLQSGLGRIVSYNSENDAVYMPAYIGKRNGPPPTYGLLEVTMDNPNGKLLERGGSDTVDWFVDRDGHILAEEEYDYRQNVQRIWGRHGKKRVVIYESGPNKGTYAAVGLGRDSHSLIVSARTAGSDFWSYFEMDLDDGSVGPPLFQRAGASVEHEIVDANRVVYGVEYSGFFPTYEFFDSALTERVQAIQSAMKTTAVYLVDWTPDFRYLVFRLTGGWTSGMYVIVGPDSLKPQLLENMRANIPGAAVAPTSVIQYQAQDGLEIPALVTARADVRDAGNAPLIVLPHGGPEDHDRFGFDWLAQYFASRGIVVLQPQFRGSTGFGATLRRAGDGQWGRAMSTDLDDGVQHLINDGLVNPERVCIVGLSYGGYAALAAGAFSSFDYKCLVAISGISDLPRMLDTEREKWGSDSAIVASWRERLGSAGKRDSTLEAVSPVNFAKNFRSPVLLVHGRDDAVVPLDQSLRMYKALKRAKKPVKLVKLDGEDHYLSGYETRLEALRAVAEFIDKNL